MSDIGKAYVQIVPSAKGLEGAISGQLEGESAKAGQSAGSSIVSTLKKVFIAAGIGKALLSTLQEGGKLQQSLGGIETLFKDNADKVKGYAKEAYRSTGLSANAYMENVTGFSASLLQSLGGDTKKAAETANMAMIDMADNSNKMGTSMEAIQNAYQGFAKQNYTMLDNLKLGYGGTKKEMERLLKDAQKITGVKYDINNLNDVYEAIHVIQGELDITGTTAKEASTTLSGSFNAMKASFQDVLGALALGEGLRPALEGLASTVSTFLFGNLFPMIGNILAQLPGLLITFIQVALPQFIQMGTNMVNSLISGFDYGMEGFWANFSEMINVLLTEYLPQFLETGVSLITELVNGLLTAIPDVITGMGEIINSIMVVAMDAIPQLLQAGYDLIKNMAQGIFNNMPAITKSIVDVLDKLLKTILDNFPEFLQKGFEIIGKMALGIWNNLPQIISTLTNLLLALIRKIGEYLPQFLQKGIELIGKLLAGIVQKAPEVIAKIPSIILQILSSIGKFVSQFVSMGGQLLMGLAKGIAGAVGNVIKSAVDACKNVVSKIKAFFGIHSPSRLFAEIGEFLDLGLAEGIKDNIKPVTSAMEELSNETQKSFTSELSHNIVNNNPKGMFDTINGESNLISNYKATENKTPIELVLHLGNKTFKTFVEDITKIQDEKIELDLAY